MRIPPYWSKQRYTGVDRKGRERSYAVWGWSFESQAAAEAEAKERARCAFENLAAKHSQSTYDYLERPLREEILEEIVYEDQLIALITRNRYGALVLNTASVCFVDVDYPQPKAKGLVDGLKLLFNKELKKTRQEETRQQTRETVLEWANANPYNTFRFYETAAGLRLLFTDRLYVPTSEEVAALLDILGSDSLYKRLTIRQECFRARLTPKPWRCGCFRPPNRYPWETEEEEQQYREWEAQYHDKSNAYGICRLLTGNSDLPENAHIAAIIETHDHYTCLDLSLPLA